jgi:hypothetical protein
MPWTQEIGSAFLAQPNDVMDAVSLVIFKKPCTPCEAGFLLIVHPTHRTDSHNHLQRNLPSQSLHFEP